METKGGSTEAFDPLVSGRNSDLAEQWFVGYLVVDSATVLAGMFGMSDRMIALTIVGLHVSSGAGDFRGSAKG